MSRRVVVIGAGPMGIEAALGALERGLDVQVYEAGRVGESLRRWGPTKLFTPMEMNLSERAREVLGPDAPDPDALLTGPQMAEQVLELLVEREPLAGRVHTGARVTSVGRRRMARHDHVGHPVRHERSFRLLVESEGSEIEVAADVVLDASGVYGQPLPAGLGGPALGEEDAEPRILRTLGELHDSREVLVGKRIALVGDGHSAANAINAIARWARENEAPKTVVWMTRSRRKRPCSEVPSDPLPERARITRQANKLAGDPPGWLTMMRRSTVHRLEVDGENLRVETSNDDTVDVDFLVALTGFRPDLGILDSLAVDIAPATEGAGGLWRAVSSITDCMSVPEVNPEDLRSGEPGFYLIGHKSYGRSNTFLLNTGRMQLETILDMET